MPEGFFNGRELVDNNIPLAFQRNRAEIGNYLFA